MCERRARHVCTNEPSKQAAKQARPPLRLLTAGDELLLDGDAGGGDHGEAAVVELLVAVLEEGLLVLVLDDLQGVQALCMGRDGTGRGGAGERRWGDMSG